MLNAFFIIFYITTIKQQHLQSKVYNEEQDQVIFQLTVTRKNKNHLNKSISEYVGYYVVHITSLLLCRPM